MNYFIGGSKMTEQVKKEIIKAYAYGKTPQEAAAAMGVSLEDAKRLQEENAEAIEERKSQLESGGWLK
jgi:hypothetical protein